jgi:hypothetical protein
MSRLATDHNVDDNSSTNISDIVSSQAWDYFAFKDTIVSVSHIDDCRSLVGSNVLFVPFDRRYEPPLDAVVKSIVNDMAWVTVQVPFALRNTSLECGGIKRLPSLSPVQLRPRTILEGIQDHLAYVYWCLIRSFCQ